MGGAGREGTRTSHDRIHGLLIRPARRADVSAAFSVEELKRTTAVPLPSEPAR